MTREAEEKFKEAKEAYEVLCDSEKRAIYDQHGHAGIDASRQGGGARSGFQGGDAFGEMFGEMFGDIFGGGRRGGGRSQVFRGADLKYELELDLNQAVFGHTEEIDVAKLMECDTCGGSGAAKGHKPVTCETCNGVGQCAHFAGLLPAAAAVPQVPRRRHHHQESPAIPASARVACDVSKRLAVKIPAGVDNGDRIRLSGEGESGRNGGPAGDLYVEVHVREHEIFERDGEHLSCEVAVSFFDSRAGWQRRGAHARWARGHSRSLRKPVGRVFRLRDKGVKPVRGGARGDLFCRVVVETPINLSGEQREMLRKFDESLKKGVSKHTPRGESFFEGVKRFFSSEPS